MISRLDFFWIKLILRLAFGFFFLIAALNIFDYGGPNDFGPSAFAADLSGSFANTWLGGILGWAAELVPGNVGQHITSLPEYFLQGLPFAFAVLCVPILTGILLRPALRLGAILLVVLGLGKYIATPTDLSTTAQDFLLALLICIGLYFLGKERMQTEIEELPV